MPSVPKSREARFGIVMYGGVSLAIYINGVGQELFRAVKGCGIYKLLKTCLDTDIIVDIVSGTSAGGINGLFLAYSLLNGKDFTQTKNLWREHGDFSRLLQSPGLDPDNCKSLLNSDKYYRARMKEAFGNLDANAFSAVGCDPSKIKEMDVFITGTSFYPDIYTTFDDAGRPIDMLEYRKAFRLKHRAGREKEGAFTTPSDPKEREVLHEALAKLARITSCFPAAFLPVRVLVEEDWARKNPREERPFICECEPAVDDKICEWGALKKSAYFLDGGVLNNKPFTPTINAIFNRTADRPVDRTLFYVEPDPESADSGLFCEPTFLSAVFNGMMGIATYQSTTDDAKVLEEHNSEVVRHNAVCQELRGKFTGLGTLATGVEIPSEASLPDPQRTLYINARNVQLGSRALRGVLRDPKTGEEPHLTSAADRERAKQLFEALNRARRSDELPFNETFRRYDIYFRQRRLHHTVRQIYSKLSESAVALDAANRRLLHGLNRHIHLMEIVQYWIEYIVDRAPVAWKQDVPEVDPWDYVWWQINSLLEQALRLTDADQQWLPPLNQDVEDYLSTSVLDQFHKNLHDRMHRLLAQLNHEVPVRDPDPSFRGLLQWTDEAEEAFFQRCQNGSQQFREFHDEYMQFVNLDAVVFPPDFLSNLQDFSEVRLMRISPSPTINEKGDGGIGFWATYGANEKLAGRNLAHFSGFLKRSWRSNDILWGRLDGLRHILLSLLAVDKIHSLRNDEVLKTKILQNLAAAGGLPALMAEVFPDSPDKSRTQLVEFFETLLSAGNAAMDEQNLRDNLNLLVEMGQLQVLYDELPEVLRDAAMQQADWNQYNRQAATAHGQRVPQQSQGGQPTNPAAARPSSNFLLPVGYTDPTLVALHAESEIASLMTSWKEDVGKASEPKKTPLGNYFENTYDVAGEGLEGGLPPLVVAGYVTQSALVANNCVLGSMEKPMRDRIMKNPIYRLGVRFPLRFSHGLIGLWTRAPKTIALTYTSVIAAALITLLIAFFWRTELFTSTRISWITTGAWLVLLPLVLIGVAAWKFRRLMKDTDY